MLLACLFLMCFAAVFSPSAVRAENIVVVFDPGHGGPESGASRVWNGKTFQEELLTLKIAKYAKQELEKYEGVEVYLTRTSNNIPYMDRSARVNFAKEKDAAALVSIHLNATAEVQSPQTGAYAFVPSAANYPDSKKYAKQARKLGDTILKQLQSYAGVQANGRMYDDELGIILYGMKAKIPSVLIEHCFLSNPSDCTNYLNTNAQLKKLGVADATAVAKCFKLTKKTEQQQPVVTGWQTDEQGNRRYYDENGVTVRSEWREIDGKYYYFGADGILQTGVIQIGADFYLTDSEGVRQKGFQVYKKRRYYADSQGKLYIGWKKYKGDRYYFSPKTGGAYLGLKKIGKNQYFFDVKTGAMQTGWQIVGSTELYFHPTNGKLQKNCWVNLNGKYYYLSSTGAPYVNTKVVINGKKYKFNKKGVCTNYR